ncbi:CarD family transcriptional regulator [Clostridium cylindrosporum]|uniref:CarD family transcriptional regulator n=1 Tax=Clostridium cylindrosporum DSM 605 TaxID=1121307 RepID=A0A0J8D774_CLOCY|nr:CarD family transcriptional regulator [Clostridium cylindrosporum]KMT21747.1 CarD family transcriptional regulator [Clostridium cylindrosporum DSM 605]
MFDQGDYVMYPFHGVCSIDEISEQVIGKVKRNYYILHPIHEANSTIMTPVDNAKVNLRAIISYEEANEVLNSIPNINMTWTVDRNARNNEFSQIIKEVNPNELAKLICLLTAKKSEAKLLGKKFSESDDKVLSSAKKLLFSELSMSLNTNLDVVKSEFSKRINVES